MPIRCTWCNNELTPDEAARRADKRVSRALCSSCSEFLVFQMGVPIQTFLDRLPAPIFVMEGDGIVKTANAAGRHLLKKQPSDIENKLTGVVFECAWSRLPEGCGRTIHCSGCAIRRSVHHTYETGESLHEVPATLHCGDQLSAKDITMLVSTEKMGEVVLLRVDRVGSPVAA